MWELALQLLKRRNSIIKIASLAVAVVAAGSLAANFAFSSDDPHPAAFDGPATARDNVAAGSGIQRFANPKPGQVRDLGSWSDTGGATRRLVLTSTDSTLASDKPQTCVSLEDVNGNAGGGCRPANDFFADAPVVWTSVTQAGQDGVTRKFFAGISRDSVATIDFLKSSGDTDSVTVNADGGFFYEVPATDRAASVDVVALVPHSDTGAALQRIATK